MPKPAQECVPRSAVSLLPVYAPSRAGDSMDGRMTKTATFPHLSPRESRVLELRGRGLTNKDIMGELGIRAGTVKQYVARILCKTGSRNCQEAIGKQAAWMVATVDTRVGFEVPIRFINPARA